MKYLFFALFFMFASTAEGQVNLIAKDNGKYIYDLQIYKWKELEPILDKSEKASKMYQSGKNHYKAAKFMFFGGLVTGLVGIAVINESDAFINESGALMILIGVAVSALALLPRIIGDNKIESSVELFNFEVIEKNGYMSNVSLSFGETRSGIGFALKF